MRYELHFKPTSKMRIEVFCSCVYFLFCIVVLSPSGCFSCILSCVKASQLYALSQLLFQHKAKV